MVLGYYRISRILPSGPFKGKGRCVVPSATADQETLLWGLRQAVFKSSSLSRATSLEVPFGVAPVTATYGYLTSP